MEHLLNMYALFSELVRDAFCNDSRFLTIRDQAFQEVVNNTDVFRLDLDSNRPGKGLENIFYQLKMKKKFSGRSANVESKCPELLANYCDLLLRKSALTKKFTSEEIDERLNNVVSNPIRASIFQKKIQVRIFSFWCSNTCRPRMCSCAITKLI